MKNFLSASAILCILFFTTQSCKKSENLVGKDGLNPASLLDSDAIDTFKLETYTYVEDSLISSDLSVALLGSYNDPVFGKFESEFYTQFRLSGFAPNFGDLNTVVIDSFVLGMEYKGYYGDFDPQRFEVYELTEDLYPDSVYYSTQTKQTLSTDDLVLGGHNVITPNPLEETVIGVETVQSQLRIFLDTLLAKKLMQEANDHPETFGSNETFLAYFKGLQVKVNNTAQQKGDGGIFYMNLVDPLSKLTIYYKLDGLSKTYDFLMNSECVYFNHITIENSGTNVESVILNPALGQTEFYAQSNNSRAVIKFPSIKDIPKSSLIQSAVLEVPVSYYSNDSYYPSQEISVSTRISETDQNLYNVNVIGEYSDFTKSYVIDLREYIQNVVSGNLENFGIYLGAAKMLTTAERIVFNGSNSVNKKQPKLKIIYTTY